MDNEVKITPPSTKRMDEIKISEPESELVRGGQMAVRGLAESVPFYGERTAEKFELPQPTTFPERLTRRTFRNLPYAAPAMYVNPIVGTAGLIAATGFGQAAEELGMGEWSQMGAEIVGGSVPSALRTVAGKTAGFIEPQLEELYKKGKNLFEFGPGARSSAGMKYGAGETEEAAIRNLNKFTEEATSRTGSATKNITGDWINQTGKTLGKEAENIFANKTFISDPIFLNEVTSLAQKAEGAFGQQGNVIKTILEKNIGGKRPGGALVEPTFNAEDLRSAIVEVNGRLSSASGNEAALLHSLKDSLENLANSNLKQYGGDLVQRYETWRKNYNAFATIRDLFQRQGSSGVTSAGQINPKTLLDIITTRTGGSPVKNPLYRELGEFGTIMQAKPFPRRGLAISGMQTLTETPLSKALQTTFQPRASSKLEQRLRTLQAISPLQRALQIGPADIEAISVTPPDKGR